MKNPWQWTWDWSAQARNENSTEKLRLPRLLLQAQSYSIEEPDKRLAYYEQGRALASQMQEPWWVILFEYWKCETLLYYKHDPEAALQLAAKIVVETRKPQYLALPQRVAIHLAFIAAYSKLDPIGYQDQIREAIEFSQAEASIYESYYQLHWQLRARFLIAIGDPLALETAWNHYHVGCQFYSENGRAHYTIYALADLLTALWLFDRGSSRSKTTELADLGLQLSPRSENQRLSVAFTMWRALGHRYDGDEKSAAQLYHRAFKMQTLLSEPRNAVYFAALAFHEVGGEWDRMLKVSEQAIDVSTRHQLHFETAKLRWQKCEILKRMGLDWGKEATRLREVVATMPSKAYWEDRLGALEETA